MRKRTFRFRHNEYDNTGLSNKTVAAEERILSKDGSFNVSRSGVPFLGYFSAYHWLISISWNRFFALVLAAFVVVNVVFTSVFLFIGFDHFKGVEGESYWDKAGEILFFSVQTLTTVGYGRISPIGFSSGIVASLESLCGLMAFALITGLLYGRFSKPNARLLFSSNALLAPYKNIRSLQFRVANARRNQLIEVEVSVIYSIIRAEENGPVRRYYTLNLERNKINFFPMPWTVVHPIEEESPLAEESLQSLLEGEAEWLILLKGFDDVFAQQIHVRYSYTAKEIIEGAKFNSIMKFEKGKPVTIQLDKISEWVPAELPQEKVSLQ
ncbi:MAG: ion channel [Cytophagaceae bacterium]|jgi:inward rectifier potassium channel|nr:ion channel [Cytophagaceae bacterium]